ncbi:hypothetical protein CYMTET_23355 [Cymbomonas tetramitiformis]|uniref:Uncharacterized protein n=1 Tax=Cymbomonas tetramitiformis TaxID=36881 RepID=A0AAE0FYH2_9CHLO|nr:hypothetical protein CYMTET_23355 [Cymbomonas tetramitiformis]
MPASGSSKPEESFAWWYVRVTREITTASATPVEAGTEQVETTATPKATLLPPSKNGNPTDKAQCLFCDKAFSAQFSRIVAHVGAIPRKHVQACKGPILKLAENESLEEFKKRKEQWNAARQQCSQYHADTESASRKKREREGLDSATRGKSFKQTTISTEGFETRQSDADKALASAMYTCNISPWNLQKPRFREALQKIALVGPSYKGPERRRVSGPMLSQEKDRVQKKIAGYRQSVSRYGSTVVSDGATDIRRRPIINLLDVSPEMDKPL